MATTFTGGYISIACFALLGCRVRIDFAQDGPTDPAALPIIVPAGAPLHIVLTRKVPVDHTGVHVEGKVVENVYVFDHLVIPAGSRVMGQVTEVDDAPWKERALAIANGANIESLCLGGHQGEYRNSYLAGMPPAVVTKACVSTSALGTARSVSTIESPGWKESLISFGTQNRAVGWLVVQSIMLTLGNCEG